MTTNEERRERLDELNKRIAEAKSRKLAKEVQDGEDYRASQLEAEIARREQELAALEGGNSTPSEGASPETTSEEVPRFGSSTAPPRGVAVSKGDEARDENEENN